MMKYLFVLLMAWGMLATDIAPAAANPFHNFNNPYDVDNNHVINRKDLDLVVDQIRLIRDSPQILPLVHSDGHFWDTSNDANITVLDAMLVVNYLLRVPEPGTVMLGTVGLISMLGVCWRKRRTAPQNG